MRLQELFKSFIGRTEVLSVFCNPNDEYSNVFGFASQMDENHFICNEISTHGKYDGYVLRKTENIFRIDYGSYYESSLFKVFMSQNVKHKEIPNSDSVFINFIQFAKASDFVVSVGIRDYDSYSITGYIDNIDIDSETLTFHSITQEKEGGFDGFASIYFNDVYRMCCDTKGDRFFQSLNELAMGK